MLSLNIHPLAVCNLFLKKCLKMPEITEENDQGNLLLLKFSSTVNTLGASELLGVPWKRVAMAEVSSV